MQAYVYILASKRNGTLYVGVTNEVIGRTYQHKHDFFESFSKKYKVHKLMNPDWDDLYERLMSGSRRPRLRGERPFAGMTRWETN